MKKYNDNIIALGWIHWVWKSTIIKEINQYYPFDKIWNFSFGDTITDIVLNKWLVKTPKDIWEIEPSKMEEILKETHQRLFDLSYDKDLILVDTHFSTYRKNWLQKATEDEISFYKKLILINLPVDILVSRIKKDKKERLKNSIDTEKVKNHLYIENVTAKELSKKTWKELLIIENRDLKESVLKILSFINK